MTFFKFNRDICTVKTSSEGGAVAVFARAFGTGGGAPDNEEITTKKNDFYAYCCFDLEGKMKNENYLQQQEEVDRLLDLLNINIVSKNGNSQTTL